MQKQFLLMSVLLVMLFAGAKCAPPRTDGIKFYDKSWQEVLNKAKTEHKLIFLDIYASWCGPCKALRNETFPDKSVGDYFNAHFVCTSFDGEVGDGVMLAHKFDIQAYPSLFILDEKGNIVKNAMGFMGPDDLLQFGRNALKE